jgi:hypothetical protein
MEGERAKVKGEISGERTNFYALVSVTNQLPARAGEGIPVSARVS